MIAKPPSSAPEKDFREPSKRPMGVRAPATITEVVLFVALMSCDPLTGCTAEEWMGVNEGSLRMY
ncbi:hypothetical protein GCM10018782_41320 [Streptomyces griseoaurantiacus]|nr:hypothetical protein GCM10018782_41320 [Streptomyces griseoaurantiacus]